MFKANVQFFLLNFFCGFHMLPTGSWPITEVLSNVLGHHPKIGLKSDNQKIYNFLHKMLLTFTPYPPSPQRGSIHFQRILFKTLPVKECISVCFTLNGKHPKLLVKKRHELNPVILRFFSILYFYFWMNIIRQIFLKVL